MLYTPCNIRFFIIINIYRGILNEKVFSFSFGFYFILLPSISLAFTYEKTADAAISGLNDETLTEVTIAECKKQCDSKSFCKSFDYHKNENICDLSSANYHSVGLKRDYNNNPFDHYSKIVATSYDSSTEMLHIPNVSVDGKTNYTVHLKNEGDLLFRVTSESAENNLNNGTWIHESSDDTDILVFIGEKHYVLTHTKEAKLEYAAYKIKADASTNIGTFSDIEKISISSNSQCGDGLVIDICTPEERSLLSPQTILIRGDVLELNTGFKIIKFHRLK